MFAVHALDTDDLGHRRLGDGDGRGLHHGPAHPRPRRDRPDVLLVTTAGSLHLVPVADRPDLLAAPVAARAGLLGSPAAPVSVAEIDPELADTAALARGSRSVPPEMSANCVVVAGRRAGDERVAACVVLATTRADVNGLVRRLFDVRKASFLAMDLAVEWTGMEYGGITPVGLPPHWAVCTSTPRSRPRRTS